MGTLKHFDSGQFATRSLLPIGVKNSKNSNLTAKGQNGKGSSKSKIPERAPGGFTESELAAHNRKIARSERASFFSDSEGESDAGDGDERGGNVAHVQSSIRRHQSVPATGHR